MLNVQIHPYLVCLSADTSFGKAGVEYYTSPLQHAASYRTGLQLQLL